MYKVEMEIIHFIINLMPSTLLLLFKLIWQYILSDLFVQFKTLESHLNIDAVDSPLSGKASPVRHLKVVDFPAPLPPNRATT